MIQKSLSTQARSFFRLVQDAAFANPFSDARLDLDRRISGVAASERLTHEALLGRELQAIRAALDESGGAARIDLRHFSEDDRRLLAFAVLFDVFHRYTPAMDAHIEAQMAAGDEPIKVEFSHDVLRHLHEHGFDPELAERYFAISFQLRRAYFFIGRGLVGNSPSMNRLRAEIWSNVFTVQSHWYDLFLWNRMEDFSTLLLGPTGAGKSRVASAIGRSGFIPFDAGRGVFSESFTRAFVSINLSQYPETLIDSELFGHSRGAFTGAVQSHDGVFARCSRHGAIFLDEIGDVSLPLQAKLLTVLQERSFTPVGSHTAKRFDGRVIAATNQPLDELRRAGAFRQDFYYRLCSHVIRLPSLQERLAEHPKELDELLASILLKMVGTARPDVVATVRAALEKSLPAHYPWPGNVRELEQSVRRILLTGSYQPEGAHESGDGDDCFDDLASMDLSVDDLLAGYCRSLYRRCKSYEEVARRTGMDRRTVKKYVTMAAQRFSSL